MCYAIPIFSNRVAPRCTIADYILLLFMKGDKVISSRRISLKNCTWFDVMRILEENRVDYLICGGIDRNSRGMLENLGIVIMDNVSCTDSQAREAIETGEMHAGFGFRAGKISGSANNRAALIKLDINDQGQSGQPEKNRSLNLDQEIDCLACEDKVCLQGKPCRPRVIRRTESELPETRKILESSLDVMSEKERTLCRLSELIYFCLGMKYKRIGIAFCMELFEQTEILRRLLRRFFSVYPVCCKIGGRKIHDPGSMGEVNHKGVGFSDIACNPEGQAEMLNRIGTDINIIVGLCMGVDCIFSKASNAPVSTLFVKDKSLAHNPIGALYSEYYLKEITRTNVGST